MDIMLANVILARNGLVVSWVTRVPCYPHSYLMPCIPTFLLSINPFVHLPNKGSHCLAHSMEKRVCSCPHTSGVTVQKPTRNTPRFQDAPDAGLSGPTSD